MRVAITQCFHEASAFSPIPITLDDFKRRHYVTGDAVRPRFAGDRDWLAGIIQHFDDAKAEIEFGLCTACLPGGIVQRESFDSIKVEMLAQLRAIVSRGPVDIVMAALHGALIVDGLTEPETEIVAEIRTLVGPHTVIAITLDFHANINPGIARLANVVVVGKLYPHTDTYARAYRAGELAVAALKRPLQSFHFRLPMLVPLPNQSTVAGQPGADLCEAIDTIATSLQLDDLSVAGGFAYGDASYVGMSVVVVSEDLERAALAYRRISATIWDLRARFLAPIPKLASVWPEVIKQTAQGRVVIADVSDSPGAGGTGNEVTLLRAILEGSMRFVSGFHVDPAVAIAAATVGVGEKGVFEFGTLRVSPRNSNLVVRAKVVKSGDMHYFNTGNMMRGARLDGGLSAVLEVEHGLILVTTERIQAYDINAFLSQGVDLHHARLVAVKTTAHFRASYTALATGGIVLIDADGWSSPDLNGYAFAHLRKPLLPFDTLSLSDWSACVEAEILAVS